MPLSFQNEKWKKVQAQIDRYEELGFQVISIIENENGVYLDVRHTVKVLDNGRSTDSKDFILLPVEEEPSRDSS